MKTNLNFGRPLTAWIATLALSTSLTAWAADEHLTMKGAQHLKHLGTAQEAEAVKPGSTLAMICAKCKTVLVTRVEKERGREFVRPGAKHLCDGCGSTIEVTGQRVDKQVVIKHTCKTCGDESTFCCATKSATPTKGMEKK